jgi:hypothetical protein
MNPYIKVIGTKALIFAGFAAATSIVSDIYKIYKHQPGGES